MNREEILQYLAGADDEQLFAQAREARNHAIGPKVHLRGLIEVSNRCIKNCHYCGIRNLNSDVVRYQITMEQAIASARFAIENNFGSVVLQAGEQTSDAFTQFIYQLIVEIKRLSGSALGVTLSLGEQSADVYSKWFEAGAHRYLLRIESSNRELYGKLHPTDHSFDNRLASLSTLRNVGYQVGTGVMIGVPFQTLDDMANDLLFLRDFDIDMCGMGPYIEHESTTLPASSFSLDERLQFGLRMISLLRILMPDINIASTTALQAIDPQGYLKGVAAGANVMMPNITPSLLRQNYLLYNNKPSLGIDLSAFDIEYGAWGDSKHFSRPR